MKIDASSSVRPLGQKLGVRSSWKDKEGAVHRPSAEEVEALGALTNWSQKQDGFVRFVSPDGTVRAGLSGRQLPGPLGGVERQITRQCSRLLVLRSWKGGRVGHSHIRLF